MTQRILSHCLYDRYKNRYSHHLGDAFAEQPIVSFSKNNIQRGSLFHLRHLVLPDSFTEQTLVVDHMYAVHDTLVVVMYPVVVLLWTEGWSGVYYTRKKITILYQGDEIVLLDRRYRRSPVELFLTDPFVAPGRTRVISGRYIEREGHEHEGAVEGSRWNEYRNLYECIKSRSPVDKTSYE